MESHNRGQKVQHNQVTITFFEKYFMCTFSAPVALSFSSLPSVNIVDPERHILKREVTLTNVQKNKQKIFRAGKDYLLKESALNMLLQKIRFGGRSEVLTLTFYFPD